MFLNVNTLKIPGNHAAALEPQGRGITRRRQALNLIRHSWKIVVKGRQQCASMFMEVRRKRMLNAGKKMKSCQMIFQPSGRWGEIPKEKDRSGVVNPSRRGDRVRLRRGKLRKVPN